MQTYILLEHYHLLVSETDAVSKAVSGCVVVGYVEVSLVGVYKRPVNNTARILAIISIYFIVMTISFGYAPRHKR